MNESIRRENIATGLEMMEEACYDARARLENEGTSLDSIVRRFVVEADHAVKQTQVTGVQKIETK
ncbi:MAG: hypothetical protein QG574_3737 [Cyanobacteriota bacterium erpe_2018_sw_21hr_WHONDRS-SW48-000092_B_bin.40]|jgi:hypothetical protein|nr:hypothetical protein [Cyanobacteriota bacterium erpe_2018_sw_21hr_WHONDRS-SW48-000092_B_bin.40]